MKEMKELFDILCEKYVFQPEIGENGTRHLQGSIWLKKAMRPTQFKLNKKIHWEKLKNDEAAIAYCSKSETRNGEVISKGLPKPIYIIENLYEWQSEIERLYLCEPDSRSVYWWYDSIGNIGKSSFVKYLLVKYKGEVAFLDGGKKADLINLIFNTDMTKCKCVIFDLPRSTKGKISYSAIESIKNGVICNTKYETGYKVFNSPHVFVFANYPPDGGDNLSLDRWVIKCLDDQPVRPRDTSLGSDFSPLDASLGGYVADRVNSNGLIEID